MISIVLVEPQIPGNIGAIARVMKNFGLKELVIIGPKADHKCEEARNRAKHAQDVLDGAKVCDFSVLDSFDTLVGTTAILGSDYNVPRLAITPKELATKVNTDSHIAILIGREGDGLSEEEILKCDFTVSIPASKEYPTLNISHACAILFYEIFQELDVAKSNDRINVAKKVDKDQAMKFVNEILDEMEFTTEDKKETQIKVWKRLIGKSFLTKREAMVLMGFFKKVIEKIKK